jgi:peptide/nickel transport system substrate-binding protein
MSREGERDGQKLFERDITRRDFLKNAAMVGAAVAVTGSLGPLAACGSPSSPSSQSSVGGAPKKGGNLRVGIGGGSTKETIDAHQMYGYPDQARCDALYDTLYRFNPETMQAMPWLAQEATPNAKATVWTVRLKPDVTFHDGKPLTADDVIFSFKRILDPSFGSSAASTLFSVDPKGFKKVDDLTVEIHMKQANAVFTESLSETRVKIVPVGYDPKNPVGTGPFKYQTFIPGERSLFVANPNYWGEGPYVDQVEVIDFKDDTSRINALVSGAVEMIAQVPRVNGKALTSQGFTVLRTECGNWDPIDMLVDKRPFNDQRVRQAFRLLADRQEIVNLALAGYGRVANDMFSPYDKGYPADLPQRTQDLEQAKSLLKAAGQEGMKIEFITSPMDDAVVEEAQVFAQQAKAAGIDMKIRKVDEAAFWDQYYTVYPLVNEYWSTRNYLNQANLCIGAHAQWDVTHWRDANWEKLVAEAWQTVDETKRNEIISEVMTIDYEKGPFIIWGYKDILDAHSSKVTGLKGDKSGNPLGDFQYETVSFV